MKPNDEYMKIDLIRKYKVKTKRYLMPRYIQNLNNQTLDFVTRDAHKRMQISMNRRMLSSIICDKLLYETIGRKKSFNLSEHGKIILSLSTSTAKLAKNVGTRTI